MTKAKLRTLITLEETVAKTLETAFAPAARRMMADLFDLMADGKWQDAHAFADRIVMTGVLNDHSRRLEELFVAAYLWGRSNSSGKVAPEKGRLPVELKAALIQLRQMVEVNIVETIRTQIHNLIRSYEMAEALQKAAGEPLYIHRPLLTHEELRVWATGQGLTTTLPPDELHVTQCYSKTPVNWGQIPPAFPVVIVEGGPRTIERFGEALVLTFESDDLQRRWMELEASGCTSDHPSYRPHVTITYDPTVDPASIEPYTGPRIFGSEVFKEITDGWRPEAEHLLKAVNQALADQLNAAVMGTGKVALDVSANLTTSRVIQYGFLSQHMKAGYDVYQVTEILDEKICPVCILMHGRVFKVANELERLRQVLLTQDVADLKQIRPWPKGDPDSLADLAQMSDDEVQARGWGTPPYHPNCRGTTVKVGFAEALPDAKMPDLPVDPGNIPLIFRFGAKPQT